MAVRILCSLFFLFAVTTHAQKIKVKKGRILLDNSWIGTVEKIKEKKDSLTDLYYKVADTQGKHILSFRQEALPSLLYHKDKYYRYYSLEHIASAKRAPILNPKFYISEKQIARYLIDYHLLDKNGLQNESVTKYISAQKELPDRITEAFEEEKKLLEYVRFKEDRVKTDPLFVFFEKTVAGNGDLISGRVTKSVYFIIQGIKDPKTNDFVSQKTIGYAVAEEATGSKIGWSVNPPPNYRPHPSGRYSLAIYNTKKVPLASYISITFKHYLPYKEFKLNETPLCRINSIEEKIRYMAQNLIENNIL